MRLTPVALGVALLALGIYFFPFGEDILFWHFLQFAGGDYWLARFYQYVVFGLCIVFGYLLIKKGWGWASNPVVIIGLLVVVALVLNIGGELF